MDQEQPIIATGLLKSENHDLTVGGEGLTGFFCPGEIDAAFRENKWSIGEMVQVLTNIVRDKETRTIERRDGSTVEEPIVTPREKMAAAVLLDKKAKEGLVLGGLITKDRLTVKKKLEDGSETEYNAEGMRLTTEASSRLKSTLAILEGASKGQGDEIINVEIEDDECGRPTGTGDLRRNGSEGGGPSLLPRQPRGTDSGPGPVGPGTDGGPDRDRSGGAGDVGQLHGGERTVSSESLPGRPGERLGLEQDDPGTTKGAEDERGSGIPVQSGRSESGQGTGEPSGGNRDGHRPNTGQDGGAGDACPPCSRPPSEGPRRPVIPGESAVKRTNWWEPGIPRRAPDAKPGAYRDVVTAESSLDRLKRIERAREQAAKAAEGYLERRAKNHRARPGESNEPRPGSGGPRATPDPTIR